MNFNINVFEWIYTLIVFYKFPCRFTRSFDAFRKKLLCQLSWEWKNTLGPNFWLVVYEDEENIKIHELQTVGHVIKLCQTTIRLYIVVL